MRSISDATELVLSADQNVFTLTFAALSYANPATNRYRYKLEGLQQGWNEVGSDRRQATYTTLPSATYTFRVQAATSRGAWSEPGIALRIKILPRGDETIWFRVSCVGRPGRFAVGSLSAPSPSTGVAVQHRAGSARQRADANRARTARHATAKLPWALVSLQGGDDRLPDRPLVAKQQLETALKQASQAITEGRDAVQGLRASTAFTTIWPSRSAPWERARGHPGERHARPNRRRSTSPVQGTPRTLRPMIRDDIYRIASEALRNAFRHARAGRIEVEIRYDETAVSRYASVTMARASTARSPEGTSRRDTLACRACVSAPELIGGHLEVWSEAGMGTEVELTFLASWPMRASRDRRRSGCLADENRDTSVSALPTSHSYSLRRRSSDRAGGYRGAGRQSTGHDVVAECFERTRSDSSNSARIVRMSP